MRIPGRRSVIQSFRWARSRVRGGVVVLGYHRLGSTKSNQDPFALCVSAEHFAAQLDVLKHQSSVLTLRQALKALDERRVPPRAVVLTFDDGYRDTVDEVLPRLERADIPATVFVTSGAPGRPFWWDELAALLLHERRLPPRLALDVRGTTKVWSVSDGGGQLEQTLNSRRQLLTDIAVELRGLSVAERDEQMVRIRNWCGGCREDSGYRSLTLEEIRRLAASPVIELGAHTLFHPALASLPDAEQVHEIHDSRTALTTLVDKPVELFSYPHGSYSPVTIAAVRRSGFTAACCSTPDVASPLADRFALPRLWVADLDGPRFDRWLRHWLIN